jgi:hypothetical protein
MGWAGSVSQQRFHRAVFRVIWRILGRPKGDDGIRRLTALFAGTWFLACIGLTWLLIISHDRDPNPLWGLDAALFLSSIREGWRYFTRKDL